MGKNNMEKVLGKDFLNLLIKDINNDNIKEKGQYGFKKLNIKKLLKKILLKVKE